MSFLDNILRTGQQILTGGDLGSRVLKTVVTGYAINRLAKSTNKSSASARTSVQDRGVVVQTRASTENKIPVLYGRCTTGGLLTDVRQSNSNNTLHYVYVLSETTGSLLSTSFATASTFTLQNVYWSGYKINFESDGITLATLEDLEGNTRADYAGEVKVWFYAAGSAQGAVPAGYTGTVPVAWDVVPGWTASWQMTNLVFAVVQVNYKREVGLVGIGDMTFDVENSMRLPGDCLYDYATNTRYGASIDPDSIKAT